MMGKAKAQQRLLDNLVDEFAKVTHLCVAMFGFFWVNLSCSSFLLSTPLCRLSPMTYVASYYQ